MTSRLKQKAKISVPATASPYRYPRSGTLRKSPYPHFWYTTLKEIPKFQKSTDSFAVTPPGYLGIRTSSRPVANTPSFLFLWWLIWEVSKSSIRRRAKIHTPEFQNSANQFLVSNDEDLVWPRMWQDCMCLSIIWESIPIKHLTGSKSEKPTFNAII